MRVRIGNQTALSAGSAERPFLYAVEQGFDAFEWFPDRNDSGAGWAEDDLDRKQRTHIKETALSRDIRLSVHAPWWANPLRPDAPQVFSKSIELARDLGASLFNLHLYYEQGAASFLDAVAPFVERLTAAGIGLSIENTPLTGPDEFNELFSELGKRGWAQGLPGMCLDIGHANLCQATRNDYLRFMDLLDPHVPIIHLHLHENYGDQDRHLALFTGPAARDPSGIEGLLKRLAGRAFSGCIILEQWPEPPTLLNDARTRLLEMVAKVRNACRHSDFEADASPHPSLDGGVWGWGATVHEKHPHPTFPMEGEEQDPAVLGTKKESDPSSSNDSGAQDFVRTLVEADGKNRSWREKLGWMRDVLNKPEIISNPDQLVYLAIYLRFIGTGQVPCREDGRHFRPNHHATMAREICERLAVLADARNLHIIRRITPWLPSSGSEFTRSEPLTLIRDIAHRNDIPRELKEEIKHTLQNKLHRCAGPEDLLTSAALLERITAREAACPPAFVAQFKAFHEQLQEFFSAGSLESQLQSIAVDHRNPEADLIRTFLDAKAEAASLSQLLATLDLLTILRERFAWQLAERSGPERQQLQLADVKLEEFAFVLLSRLVNRFEGWHNLPESAKDDGMSVQKSEPEAPGPLDSRLRGNDASELEAMVEQSTIAWPMLMQCVRLTVGNLRCSGFDRDECRAIEAELAMWGQPFDPGDGQQLLRLKATLERTRRLADDHRDKVLAVFPRKAAELGRALGVPEPAIKVYAESELRGHLVFQLSKMLALSLRTVRERAGLPPWEMIVPGAAIGRLVASPNLERLPPPAEPVIVLLDRLAGDEEIPTAIKGIMVLHETPFLSHFAVRAREAGVVLVACADPGQISLLQPFIGRSAVLTASRGEVKVTSASDPAAPSANSPKPHHPLPHSELHTVELTNKTDLLPLAGVSAVNGGRKAYGARLLEELARRDGADFSTPGSLVIPFGAMEAALRAQPSAETEYFRLLGNLDSLPPKEFHKKVDELRSLIKELTVPMEFTSGVIRQFGPDARLMVRSSANCEDLAGLSAAGLYESIANVDPCRIGEAVIEVWASLWTRRAALGRKSGGLAHERACMAVLIQELILPDLSFIVHTHNPLSTNADELLVELVVGLGQTLASAEQLGTPYRLVCDKVTGDLCVRAFADFSEAVLPGATAGTVTEKLDYSRIKFSTDASHRASIGKRLSLIGRLVEAAFGAPQDIEGVIAGETITLVQSRPQGVVGG